MAPIRADQILDGVYEDLRLSDASDEQKYSRIYDVRDALAGINARTTIAAGTTGTISERICELALRSVVDGIYFRLPAGWNWLGDFYVLGTPFNTVVSVKSFKARERLIASGSGNLLAPTIGFGLFNDPAEFSAQRIERLKFRAFFAIYAPQDDLLDHSDKDALSVRNINGRCVMRPVENLPGDLKKAAGDSAPPRLNPSQL